MGDTEAKRIYESKSAVKTGGSNGVWFFGFIGALVYFLHVHSGAFLLVVLAFLKAIVWPAYVVYHLFLFLKV